MIKKTAYDKCFNYFKEPIKNYALPKRFTFPFNYEPHPLCILAAKELQNYLENQTDFEHNFGLENNNDDKAIGKMFGILIVHTKDNNIGYLKAYSGKLAGRNNHPQFVPPIFNLLDEDGFYRKGEDIISRITYQIEALENNSDFLKSKNILNKDLNTSAELLKNKRKEMKIAKKERQVRREKAKAILTPEQFEKLNENLKNESLDIQYAYKRLAKEWKDRLAKRQQELELYLDKINSLKEERKNKSAALQKVIFEKFSFLNYNKKEKSLYDIFLNTSKKIPPAGAGECSAPKLLQYAYQNEMKPLAMAEFWWGASPKSEVRKHKYFYPSCRGKCEPILSHMLGGLEVDKNPMLNNPALNKDIEIIFEDNYLLVINKPAEFLSVPGKNIEDSVYSRIKQKLPEATGPLIVHRLDMSTSGLMIVAKSMEVYKNLQNQFLERKVKKRYVALLDGIIEENEGIIDLPLRVDLDNRPYQLVCYQYGKAALTKWKVIKRFDDKTKVHFFPITGRTHQLRVHAAHQSGLNTPIAGDDLYGAKGERLCLHAEYINFLHPISNKVMKFTVNAEF